VSERKGMARQGGTRDACYVPDIGVD